MWEGLSDYFSDKLTDSLLLGFWQWLTNKQPAVRIGSTGTLLLRRPYTLRGKNANNHKAVRGLTQRGKSKMLANMAVQLIEQDIGCAIIDPHGDLARDCLRQLMDHGYFEKYRDPVTKTFSQEVTEKLWYIDFNNKEYFLPWDVLKSGEETDTTARNIVKVFKRAWPDLEQVGRHFENVLYHGVYILIENHLPLTELEEVLSKKSYRESLLKQIRDPMIHSYFHNRFDLWESKKPEMKESTLNKLSNITSTKALRYAFAQDKNVLNFREIMDSGRHVLFDLAGLDEDTQRLIGCFLAFGFEQAALSREDIVDELLRRIYHLIMDEFHLFSSTTTTTFTNVLAFTLKYGMPLTLAYQTLSQIPKELQGALENCTQIDFRQGYADSVVAAQQIGEHNAQDIKYQVPDLQAQQHVNPVFLPMQESYNDWAKKLKNQHVRSAMIRVENRTEDIKTLKLPPPKSTLKELQALKDVYAEALMTKRALVEAQVYRPFPDTDAEYGGRRFGFEE